MTTAADQKRVPAVCSGCGCPFLARQDKAKKTRKFCSRECFYKNNVGAANPIYTGVKHQRNCQGCGGLFWVKARDDAENPHKFCSKKCADKGLIQYASVAERNKAARRRREVREKIARAQYGGTHTEMEWRELLERCGHRCARCGSPDHIERDHIIPIARGGSDLIENIQPLCMRCNRKKRSKMEPDPLIVMAIDVGMTVGWCVMSEEGGRPEASSFEIPCDKADLGYVKMSFEQSLAKLVKKHRPDVIAFADPFVGRFATPDAMYILFGLSMAADAFAVSNFMRCVTVAESDARRAFFGSVPRKSRDIKRAAITECSARGWPAYDSHCCDATVVAAHVMGILRPATAHLSTPLFAA